VASILTTQKDDLQERLNAETSRRSVAEEQARRVEEMERTLATERTEVARLSGLLADATARLDAQKAASAEKLALLDQARERLADAFKALSADALRQSAPEFLRLAAESFGKLQESARGDLASRQEAIAGLLKPLEESLRTYQQRLQQGEASHSAVLGEVRKQLDMLTQRSDALAKETERFRTVLKSPPARGRWGEETLRRVVEAAGMSPHCDFIEQAVNEDSKPDMVVRLPGDRLIIVDSKVPSLDFVEALESSDAERRATLLRNHADRLKETIRDLGKRDYPSQFPGSLDHVILFLPAESLFSAALEGDRELVVWAAEKRIMLATPASLIALLRSVSVSWQQHAQTQNAREIAQAAAELYGRTARFIDHYERIRSGLAGATKAYNDAVGSFESRVRPAGERLVALGAAPEDKRLPQIDPADETLRLPPSA
jgi:DNA recombination protein RmuC